MDRLSSAELQLLPESFVQFFPLKLRFVSCKGNAALELTVQGGRKLPDPKSHGSHRQDQVQVMGLYLFGFLPPGWVGGCSDGTLLTFIPLNPAEMWWKILSNFNNTKHFPLFFPLSFLGTHPHFVYDCEANKAEMLPVAGDGNGDPHTTRFPGVLSKHETQVKGLMMKLSVGTGQPWFHLPGERGGRRGAACSAEEIKQLNRARLEL